LALKVTAAQGAFQQLSRTWPRAGCRMQDAARKGQPKDKHPARCTKIQLPIKIDI